jgi:hypothetical protein
MRHQPHHIAGAIADAGNAIDRPVGVGLLTSGLPLSARDTVGFETLANLAMSSMVTGRFSFIGLCLFFFDVIECDFCGGLCST